MAVVVTVTTALRPTSVRLYAAPRLHLSDLGGLWLLTVPHGVLCLIAAVYGGYRFFATEHFRGTLEPTLLLPYRPAQWILHKLLFPVLLVLTAWVSALPIYVMAAAADLESPAALGQASQKPLLVGLFVVAAALLVTPELLKQQQFLRTTKAIGTRRNDLDAGAQFLLLMACGYLTVLGLGGGNGVSGAPVPWYLGTIPEAWLWITVGSALITASLLTGMTAVVSDSVLERWARVARWMALAVVCGAGFGLAWPTMPSWQRWAMPWLLPLMIIGMRHRRTDRREDGYSTSEIEWMQTRWDNPLLLNDLRIYSRFWSIRRYARYCTAVIVTVFMLAGAMILWWDGSAIGAEFVLILLSQILIQSLLGVSVAGWFRSWGLWHKEWTRQTLPLLLLTPLSSSEIVGGRLLAVPIYYGAGMWPLWLAAAIMVVWATVEFNRVVAPLVLPLCPLALSLGVWLSCGVKRESPLTLANLIGDPVTLLLRVIQGVVLLLCLGFIVAGILTTSVPAPPFPTPLTLLVGEAWGLSLLLFVSNSALCWAWYRLRVCQLEQFRHGDMTMPGFQPADLPPLRSRRKVRLWHRSVVSPE